MTAKAIAIAIDGPTTELLDTWLAEGLLPNLAGLARAGARGGFTYVKRFRNERSWDTFLGGREMAGSGSTFIPQSYGYFNDSLQREDGYVPFYALCPDLRVCMFDLPATLCPAVKGIQVTGWGSELNSSLCASVPPELMGELVATYGPDPKLTSMVRVVDGKSGEEERSYVLPSLYDVPAVLDFKAKLLTSIERRTNIALDLLARDSWDLFIATYPESHTANHILWHLGETHPLGSGGYEGHALLENLQAVDRGIGRLLAAEPAANALIFTIDYTAQNAMDVPGMALLPELLYRWCFPGQQALARGDIHQPVPPLSRHYRNHWKHEVWALRTAAGEAELVSPATQEAAGDGLSWNPANWYRPLWPKMKAFALPSVADGYVRLNVKGREGSGLVAQEDFQKTLEEVGALLLRAINPRTGRALVRKVIPVRDQPMDKPEIPVDLIVCWDDHSPADTLDSPDVGRIGPLPYFRAGGHVSHGTVIENRWFANGPDVVPGAAAEGGRLQDIAATILQLAGAAVPDGIDGRPLCALRPDIVTAG